MLTEMVASYQVVSPDPLTFTKPEQWLKWNRWFKCSKSPRDYMRRVRRHKPTLIYSIKDEAYDILRSFKLSKDDVKKYCTVKKKFEGFFVKRQNVIYESVKFDLRKQEKGETVAAFINDLYILVEH